jgi:hypothetical protein
MRFALVAASALLMGTLSSQISPDAASSLMPNPAKIGSRLPFLATLPSGEVAMSWIEPNQGSFRQLLFATLKGRQWSKPQSITAGDGLMLNWADFPSISASGRLRASHWLERGTPGDGSYYLKIGIKIGLEGGPAKEQWKTVFSASAETADGYTGFLSFANFNNRLFAAFLHNKPSGTSLRMVQLQPDGKLLKEEVLDDDVCSCCQTSAAATENGPIVVYRDHEQGHLRDISVIRNEKGTWTKPVALHRDGWQINACPVNGPTIVADGNFVAVAWYTGAQGNPRVLMTTSNNSGRSFSPPVRVDGGKPVGRVSIALSDAAGKPEPFAAITWLERLDDASAAVQARIWRNNVGLSKVLAVAKVPSGRLSGFPRIALTGNTLLIAWTEDRVKTWQTVLTNQ